MASRDSYEKEQKRIQDLFDAALTSESSHDPFEDDGEFGSDADFQPSGEVSSSSEDEAQASQTRHKKHRTAAVSSGDTDDHDELSNHVKQSSEIPVNQEPAPLVPDQVTSDPPNPTNTSPRVSDIPLADESWSHTIAEIPDFNFDSSQCGITVNVDDMNGVLDFFYLAFPENYIEYLVNCTNSYGNALCNSNRPHTRHSRKMAYREVTSEEIMKFLGLSLLKGHIKCPKQRNLFSLSDPLYYHPIFSFIMSGRRYEQILRCLYASELEAKGENKLTKHSRATKILALPNEHAQSDVSGKSDSDDEIPNSIPSSNSSLHENETSPTPSVDSSLVRAVFHEDDSDEDAIDTTPVVLTSNSPLKNIEDQAKTPKKAKRFSIDYNWKRSMIFAHTATIEENDNYINIPEPEHASHLAYFHKFFSPDILDDIVEQTNLYSTQNTVADLMPLKRYQQIRSSLHFVDNLMDDGDRYYKVRPVVEKVRQNCLAQDNGNRYSIDEMMIPYKGGKSGKRKQYMKDKPTKWGFKNFTRASVNGMIRDFVIYGGEDTFRFHKFTDKDASLGFGAQIVLALCQSIKRKPAIIFCDNFFTSPELLNVVLREECGIFGLGTLRGNRLRGAEKILPDDKSFKKQGRGKCAQVLCDRSKLAVVKWNDNKSGM
ncbi:hypothetical protein HF086_007424 [Spodoptera exigua]|uniref:PiggyBac transposable element-derived protein domain-containing protein n=1 Tax=Spodoptera exigua TaxID=7107 RepID=A0A922MT09_SPOEX|nr:hypothetical protein HF086_007424 [Spodoptera exigua]